MRVGRLVRKVRNGRAAVMNRKGGFPMALRKAAAWLLAVALIGSEGAGSVCMAAENGAEAEGGAGGEVVRISSAQDLLEMADGCREDWYSYGKDFHLEADLDLTGTEFNGVAYFNGTFHGNGHTIRGVRLEGKGSDYGFFRYIGIYGSVEGLQVEGRVEKSGTGENIGGIAGVNFGLISGCTFQGQVDGDEAVGGIVGYNKADGRILDCTCGGWITAADRTGGICGENKGTIQDCLNESTVNGEDMEATLDLDGVDLGQLNLTQNVVTRNDSGGIVGLSSGTVMGCVNRGTVGYAHVGYNVGGIAGRHSGNIIECRNEGEILGRKDVGGIVGQAEPYMESEYLSDRLEKLQDDLGRMNSLVVQMSDALSRTSSEASAYTKTLQQQYEDTVDSLNREVEYLRDSISEDREATRGYIDSISQALENMSEIGNDTVNRVTDQINGAIDDVNRTVNDVRQEVKDRIDQEMDKIDKDKIELPDLRPGGDDEDGKDKEEDGGDDSEDGTAGEDGSGTGNGSSAGGNGNGGSGTGGNGSGGNGSGTGSGGSGEGGSGGSSAGSGGSGEGGSGGSSADGGGSGEGGSGGSSADGGGSGEGGSGGSSADSDDPDQDGGRDGGGSDTDADSGRSGGDTGTEDSARTESGIIRKGGHASQRSTMSMAVVLTAGSDRGATETTAEWISCTSGGSGGEGGAPSGNPGSSEEGAGNMPEGTDGDLPDLDVDIDRDELEEEVKNAREDLSRKEYIRTDPDPEIKNNLDRMKDEISGISSSMRGMYDSISAGEEAVGDAAGNISNELTDQSKLSGDTIDELADSVDNGIQSVTSSLNGLMSTQRRISESVGEDLDILMGNEEANLDLSSENIEKRTQGVVSGCVNYGAVQADLNLGGIAGIMNVEYDISPEMDLDLSGLTDVTVRSTTYDVLIHCINYGKVTAKKNFCGGVAGYEELGLIYDCENYGSVRTEDGSRAGGIAGRSTSSIQNSYAFCNISGTDYLGGISGDGFDIGGCAAMCRIESDGGEYVGSIAGCVDEEADISGNFFTSDQWEGIDDISYFGMAQGCTYEELMEMGMPQGFTMVTVTFEKDEEEIGTLRIPYGGTVEEEDVPDPAVEDGYLSWDREFPVHGVTENITIGAQEHNWVTSLASEETDGREKPLFLVEGRFYEDSCLLLAECAQEKEGAAYAYAWSVMGGAPEGDPYVGHFLLPEGAEDAAVWILAEGSWHQAETQRDGNYVTAPVLAGESFAVCPVETDGGIYILAGAAACVLVLAVLLLLVRKKRKKRKAFIRRSQTIGTGDK